MKVLLDTHIFLWAVLEPERLPTRLRTLIESPETELISAASAWEIATKRLGKLHGATEILKRYPMVIATLGATELPVLRENGVCPCFSVGL
ncbi:MAG: type II toxin-antitoxin system VapC family toxin [Pseudomonadota bacterium]